MGKLVGSDLKMGTFITRQGTGIEVTMIQFASFLLLVLSISSARSFAPRDTCPPKPPTIPELNVTSYLGNWYQYEGIPAFFAPSGTSCIRATYGDRGDGTVSVRNVDVSPSGSYEQICGYAEIPDPSHPGDLLVYFPFAPASDYWIIGTDYENYASVYSCVSLLVFKIEFAWVLVRDPNPSEEILEKARNEFRKNGITTTTFEKISQKDCVYDRPDVPSCN